MKSKKIILFILAAILALITAFLIWNIFLKPQPQKEIIPVVEQEYALPAVGEFLKNHVAGETPIPYEQYFAKMGVTEATIEIAGNPFLKGQTQPYITVNPATKEIMILPDTELNVFMTTLGLKNNDTLLAFNGKDYNLDNIYDLIMASINWKDGDAMTVKFKRDGKEQTVKGKVVMPKEKQDGYQATDDTKKTVREAWLRG